MQDVEIIGMIKSYVKTTLTGMGALKGAACQIQSITDSGTTHTIVFAWEDNNGVTHTSTLAFDSTDELSKLTDITITNLADGEVLAYDSTTQKWVNTANSATVQSLANVGDVTITSIADGQFLKWDNTASEWVNASLDYSDSAVAGNYVTAVSEADGVIAVTREAADNAPTDSSTKMVTSGGVKTYVDDAIEALDVSDSAVAGNYVTAVSETDGKISVTREAADNAPTTDSTKMVTSGGVKTYVDSAIEALDVTDSATAGSYVTTVSETDGKIAVTKEAADATPTASSKKMVTSEGIKTYVDSAIEALDVTDAAVAGSYVTAVSETDGAISVTREASDSVPTEDSTKMVQSGGVYDAINDVYVTNGVMGAKNLFYFDIDKVKAVNTAGVWNGLTYTINEVAFTINDDGTVTANGTASSSAYLYLSLRGTKMFALPVGKYIETGSPSVGCQIEMTYTDSNNARQPIGTETGEGQAFEVTSAMISSYFDIGFNLYVIKDETVSNVVFYPMIRLASDTDSTYVPYVPTNAKLNEEKISYADNGVLGAKNLAKPINSISYLDITVVCDENGVLSLTGTASASGGRLNIVSDSFILKAGTYKVVHTSNDLTKYASMVCHKKADNTSLGYSIINNGTIDNSHAQFTLTSDTECFMGLNTYQGTNYGTGEGTKEYVMVVLADDTDTTYQPYAKTNQQLTDGEITSVTFNGVSQTISNNALTIDGATNLITEAQWTTLQSMFV